MLVRHHFLSLDPYMRGRMNDAKSYAAPQALNKVMVGGTVGEVVESKHPAFAPATASSAWAAGSSTPSSTAVPGALRKVDTSRIPLVGLSRRGRHAGRHRMVRAHQDLRAEGGADDRRQRGSGAVGSVVGQLAKARGCRAVGIAGGPRSAATSSRSSASTPASTTRRIRTRSRCTPRSRRRRPTASTAASRTSAAPSSTRRSRA